MTRTWAARVAAISPGGSQTISKSLASYGLTGVLDDLAEHGKGAYLWTTARQVLLDYGGALGANVLGYRHEGVRAAVTAQLRKGGLFSLPHALEADIGERLCAVIPCADMIRFTRTGSESCVGAVRIARAETGRNVVLYGGYHGWHGDYVATKEVHHGVPWILETIAKPFRYNDLDHLTALCESYRGDVAAIMLEPSLMVPPAPNYLRDLVTLAHAYGALVIFDEMVLSPRLARAGGQEFFSVTPDLSVHGKGWGNGLSLSFIVGRRDLMTAHGPMISGTFGGDALALAACGAVLDVYAREPICDQLRGHGQQLVDGFLRAASEHGLAWTHHGWPQVGTFSFDDYCEEVRAKATALFTQAMLRRKILWHPRIYYLTAAHHEREITRTIAAAWESLLDVRKAIESGDWSSLRGVLPTVPFARKA